MLTAKIDSLDGLEKNDWRHVSPRFHGQAFIQNKKLVDAVSQIAKQHNVTTGQIALAWLLAQGDDIFPIPGTKRISYLGENFGAIQVKLSTLDLEALQAILDANPVAGKRYPADAQELVDHE